MTDNKRKTALYDMIYLTSCAVNNIVPDKERTEKMTLENVYTVSRRHLLNAITYYALESASLPANDVLVKWRDSRDKAIRKNMMLNAGRMQILSFLDSIGCWYLPLKGVYLQELYPKSGMRQMSDNDILFDKKYRREVREWFLKNGYKCMLYEKSNHDTYEKAPVFNYEMHVALFNRNQNESFINYYDNIRSRLIKNDAQHCELRFSDEDFYVYITTHLFKHYQNAGTGLRSLLDTYVIVKEKGEILDWEYIEKETKKLGIFDFEKNIRGLSKKVFGETKAFSADKLSAEETKMLERFLFSGAYGTMENVVKKHMDDIKNSSGKTSKFKYIIRRIFPNQEFIKKNFPFYYRHKILLPILWIKRIFRGLTVSRKHTKGELKALKKIK